MIIKNAVIEEEIVLQNLCASWKDKEFLEGNAFSKDYIERGITEGYLPPITNASKDNHRFKSIYLKEEKEIIGLIDLYLGYPNENTLWIGMFLIGTEYQSKGYAHEAFQLLEKSIVDQKINKIGIGVYLKNWRGLRFWVKEGFTKINGIVGDKEFSNATFSIISLEKELNVSRETLLD